MTSSVPIPQMTPVCTFQIPLLNSNYQRRLVSENVSWQAILTLDRKSDDFTHLARQLLSDQRTRKAGAPKLPEEEALKVIELIEQAVCLILPVLMIRDNWSEIDSLQILNHPGITGELKGIALTLLRRLCGTFGRLPRSCLINEDFKTREEIPFATRGYTDLWKRDWNGRKVAVKALRFGPDDDRSKTTKVAILFVG